MCVSVCTCECVCVCDARVIAVCCRSGYGTRGRDVLPVITSGMRS